mmetsp:Transcript_3780/g.8134  ORF Transcript_3780/g.8134 Transcript_3780/m.8134 type:complete len:215 (-) Transcript_3780:176-820(-)
MSLAFLVCLVVSSSLVTYIPSLHSFLSYRILGKLVHPRPKQTQRRRIQIRILQRKDPSKYLRRSLRLQSHPPSLPGHHGKGMANRQGRRNEPRAVLQNSKFLFRQRRRHNPRYHRKARIGKSFQSFPRNYRLHQNIAILGSGIGVRREQHPRNVIGGIERSFSGWQLCRFWGGGCRCDCQGQYRQCQCRCQFEAMVEGSGRLPRRSAKTFPIDG